MRSRKRFTKGGRFFFMLSLAGLLYTETDAVGSAKPKAKPKPPTPPATQEAAHIGLFDADEARKVVEGALNGATTGLRGVLHQRTVVPLALSEALKRAKSENPALRALVEAQGSSAANVVGAKAAFDPTLQVALSGSGTRTFDRVDSITRWRMSAPTGVEFGQAGSSVAGQPDSAGCISIDFAQMTCLGTPYYATKSENASYDSPSWTKSWKTSFGVSKAFGWGSSFSTGLTVLNSPPGYVLPPGETLVPMGDKLKWTSTLSVQLSTPLPYTKGFGAEGAASSVALSLAEVADQKAKADYQTALNQTLGSVEQAYWNLVQQVWGVVYGKEYVQTLSDIQREVERLYRNRLRTEYDMTQANANLASAQGNWEVNWKNLVQASDRLSYLLGMESNTLILPIAYDATQEEIGTVGVDQALATAVEKRSELRSQAAAVESGITNVRYYHNQLRPDITLTLSTSIGEVNTTVGFPSMGEAVSNLKTPDYGNLAIGVFYRYPFGRHDAKARLAGARIQQQQAEDALVTARQQVTRDVQDAITAVRSGDAQMRFAQATLQLARTSYDKATGRQQQQLQQVNAPPHHLPSTSAIPTSSDGIVGTVQPRPPGVIKGAIPPGAPPMNPLPTPQDEAESTPSTQTTVSVSPHANPPGSLPVMNNASVMNNAQVTQFELLQKLSDLNQAQLAMVQAAVQRRQAYALLRMAQGIEGTQP